MIDFNKKSPSELEGVIFMSKYVSKLFFYGFMALLGGYCLVRFTPFIEDNDLPEFLSMSSLLMGIMFFVILSAYMSGFFLLNSKRAGKALRANELSTEGANV